VDEAIEPLERAADLDGSDAEVLTLLASLYQRAGRSEDAVACYRRAIEADDHHVGAHLDLGLALLSRGEYDQAAPLLERACALQPENAEAHYALGVLRMDSGDDAGALESFRIYQSLGGDDARVRAWVDSTGS
jgi:Flp pilus assembly protein TadD